MELNQLIIRSYFPVCILVNTHTHHINRSKQYYIFILIYPNIKGFIYTNILYIWMIILKGIINLIGILTMVKKNLIIMLLYFSIINKTILPYQNIYYIIQIIIISIPWIFCYYHNSISLQFKQWICCVSEAIVSTENLLSEYKVVSL